ncbi:MAG: hypothetical protein H7Y27_11170 [Gemmatimonadaceae bacterium]|nr:hypothetical protein [Chitinophagaceae bacterium]
METFNNLLLLENYFAEEEFDVAGISNEKGYQIKKLYFQNTDAAYAGKLRQRFPTAETVQSMNDITDDHGIELILISAPKASDFNMLGQVLRAGKHVRIV